MEQREAKRYFEFDEFRIDLGERRLECDSAPVALTPKVFDILLVLVENHGRTITKETLLGHVWGDAFVEEGNLSRSVSTLRRALGEDAHGQRFIKTVPKRGYRFDGTVREVFVEDESITVERRTDYRLALRETTETRSETRLSPVTIIAVAASVILVTVLAWGVLQPRTGANAVAALAPETNGRAQPSAEVHELYTKARDLWQNRSVTGLHQAMIDLERVVRLDPDFARGHAALADAYAFDGVKWKDAERTAREAIRLDPTLGQPHATIGFVRMFWEWKFSEAELYFKEAIALEPNYATAHQWYAVNLAARNLGGAGLAEIERAHELDPSSLAIIADLCQILYFAKKYDQAIAQCRRTLEIDPNFLPAHQLLYSVYAAAGQPDNAFQAYMAAERLNMTNATLPENLSDLEAAYASGGKEAFWREQVKLLEAWTDPHAYPLAQNYARLGRKDEALFWFKRSYEKREFEFVMFAADPTNQKLSDDARHQALEDLLLAN